MLVNKYTGNILEYIGYSSTHVICRAIMLKTKCIFNSNIYIKDIDKKWSKSWRQYSEKCVQLFDVFSQIIVVY